MSTSRKQRSALPGFGLTMGYTLLYLSLIVLIPLSALLFKTFSLTWPQFWEAVASPRVLASYRLTFGASFAAACVNLVFGLLIAWVLVRYKFPGKKIVDALIAARRNVVSAVIDTPHGHDAFLLPVPRYFEVCRAYMLHVAARLGIRS